MNTENKKHQRARIVGLTQDAWAFNELKLIFGSAGYELLEPREARNADLCIIDLRAENTPPKKARSLAGAMRKRSPETSILFVTPPSMPAVNRAALRKIGDVTPALNNIEHIVERARQLLRLRNIAEESGERLKSLATLNRLADYPLIAVSDQPLRFLIAGSPDVTALAAINHLSAVAEDCTCVLTAGQAIRALDQSNFDCVIFLPMATNDPLFSLAQAIRRRPNQGGRNATTATIHIAEDSEDLAAFSGNGVRDFVLAEHLSDDLAAKAQLAGRRARLTNALRRFLNTCAGEQVRDKASRVFSPMFLTEHGSRLYGRADQTGRHLSAILVDLSRETGRDKASTEVDQNNLHQAARLIRRIVRVEDFVARIATNKFIVLTPATISDDAAVIANRINGVLANTAFSDEANLSPFSMQIRSVVHQRAKGEAIEETVATMLKKLSEPASSTPLQQQSPQ